MALTGRVSGTVRATYTKTSDLATPEQDFDLTAFVDFANGVGAGQANVLFADTRTLTASSTEDLDLTGSLTDAFGASVVNARIKAIFLRAASGNTNNVIFGAASATQWTTLLNSTGTLTLHPGEWILAASPLATGWTVTAATGDLFKAANSGGTTSVTYDIVLIGGAT